MPLNVRFSCNLRRSDDVLLVSYAIENLSNEEAGAFDRLREARLDGTNDFSRDLVYVDAEGEDLHLRKMALSLPPGLQVAGYMPPDVSRIPGGGRLDVTIRVSMPVRVCHPYKRALVRGEVIADVPGEARALVVSIGVFPCDAGCRLVQEHPAFPDVLSAVPRGLAVTSQVTLSERFVLDPPVPFLDYRGIPWSKS